LNLTYIVHVFFSHSFPQTRKEGLVKLYKCLTCQSDVYKSMAKGGVGSINGRRQEQDQREDIAYSSSE